ncbi:hypothetical protein K501DRAFT_272296 [Backusella circina FSU 941]|nr:hypothetical protein K501DRAFT_272296 [Backusella circina FSU 941]
MSAYGSGRAKDTDFRRTWNKEEYAAKAKARESRDKFAEKNDERRKLGLPALKQKRIEEEDDGEPKELMKIRDKKIDLESNIGKIQVVQDSKQPGYYCKACDITVKDSINYLDHINGRKHLQNVGVTMKVEKATLSSVQERLAMLKRKKENPKQEQYGKLYIYII